MSILLNNVCLHEFTQRINGHTLPKARYLPVDLPRSDTIDPFVIPARGSVRAYIRTSR